VIRTDDELVRRARAGDLGAFEGLVRRHRDVVHRVAARVAEPADADDVVQDTFLRAFHRLDRYRGDGAFRAWLLQIAHNTAVSSVHRDAGDVVPFHEDLDGGDGKTPADALEGAERRRRLAIKVKGLAPQHRTVLVLRDIEGFSYEEIAEITATPLGSVKARLHRARRELIDLLRRNTYDWELPRE
jgi:RNA polymerase sigma-70 factor (ECF subfamily)